MTTPKIMEISCGAKTGPIPASDAPHPNEWYNQHRDDADFDNYHISEEPLHTRRHLRIVCVGAGAAGLQLAYKAERALQDVDLQIYEKNADVGGTWLENRYPGCTCDIPSHAYQFSWARNPAWSACYTSADEIWRYLREDIAERFGLLRYVRLRTRVVSATWDDEAGRWQLKIKREPDEKDDQNGVQEENDEEDDWCDILISASGILNSWKYPDIPGLSTFQGKTMHSAHWDPTYDPANKTVAVVGGGSSAVQLIPAIQPRVGHLTAFLRSPVWITPGFGARLAGPGGTNFAYGDEQVRRFREDPRGEYDAYCREVEGELNKRFNLMHLHSDDQRDSRRLVAGLMAEKLGVRDDGDGGEGKAAKLAARMIPDFALGCRRMTPGDGYLESLTRENVEVVHSSVVRLTETGVVDEAGVERPVDAVIFATGFNTSFTPHFKVTGRNGADIAEQFGDFPKGYLGITVENFPNMFLLVGPNSPTSHASFLPVLEWYTRYIFQMIDKFQTENIKSFEPKKETVRDYYNHTHQLMKRLAWSSPCRSWFKNGKEHGPVTAVYPGSRLHFFEMLKNVRWEDYEIGYRTGNRFQFMGNGYTHRERDPDGDLVWYFDDPYMKL